MKNTCQLLIYIHTNIQDVHFNSLCDTHIIKTYPIKILIYHSPKIEKRLKEEIVGNRIQSTDELLSNILQMFHPLRVHFHGEVVDRDETLL
jgi:hypothetical protein